MNSPPCASPLTRTWRKQFLWITSCKTQLVRAFWRQLQRHVEIVESTDNDEPTQSGTLEIGSPGSFLESGKACFNVSVSEDMLKEAVELFTLTLTSSDPCVWLGRDRALLSVEENGGKGNLV